MKYTNYLIINNFYIQVQRIWINGIGHYEPGFDQWCVKVAIFGQHRHHHTYRLFIVVAIVYDT